MNEKPHVTMTPEDLALDLFTTGQSLTAGRAEAERLLQQIKDRHAHQLAEQQREAIRKTDDPVFYEGEAGWLPNLIDPETAR